MSPYTDDPEQKLSETRPRSHTPQILGFVALAVGVGAFAYFAHALFLKYPPVWPDEPLYVDPAIVLIRHGTPGLTLLGNLFPGARSHSFLWPPVCFLYAWIIFKLFGIGIIQARLGSLVMAPVILFLTYGLARKCGMSRSSSLLVPALLALDTLFLRGALIARGDIFSLALVLLSIYLSSNFLEEGATAKTAQTFIAGISMGLASVTALVGACVYFPYLASVALSTRKRFKQVMLPLLAGAALPPLAWCAYAGIQWRDFIREIGTQLGSKEVRHPFYLPQLLTTLVRDVAQYGITWLTVISVGAAWIAGIAGLAMLARNSKLGRVLLVCQLFMLALLVWGEEIWYGLFLAPLTMLGLIYLARLIAERSENVSRLFLRRAAGWVGIFLALWMTANSLNRTLAVDWAVNGRYASRYDYMAWAKQISEAIPDGSTVLISVIPDPYFVLCQRKDLKLREFPPAGFRIATPKYDRYISSANYVLAGGPVPNDKIWSYTLAHGRLVGTVGEPPGYFVGIFKLPTSSKQISSAGAKASPVKRPGS